MTTKQLKLSPEGMRKKLMKWCTILEAILNLLYRSPDWRVHDLPPPNLAGCSNDAISRDPLVKGIGRRVGLLAQAKSVVIDALATRVAAQLGIIAARLRENDPSWR